MLPHRVSNPGPVTYESCALPIALRGPAHCSRKWVILHTGRQNMVYNCYLSYFRRSPDGSDKARFVCRLHTSAPALESTNSIISGLRFYRVISQLLYTPENHLWLSFTQNSTLIYDQALRLKTFFMLAKKHEKTVHV